MFCHGPAAGAPGLPPGFSGFPFSSWSLLSVCLRFVLPTPALNAANIADGGVGAAPALNAAGPCFARLAPAPARAGGRAFVPARFARLIAPARAKAERRAHVSHRFLRVLFSRRREREETGPARMPVPSCRPILARPIPMSRLFQRITSYIVNKQLAAVTGPAEQAPCLEGRRRHACPDSGERGA